MAASRFVVDAAVVLFIVCVFFFRVCYLALDGSYTGENFAFDGFEESAAAGRYVADAVCLTEFVDAGNAVAAAYE